MNERKPEVWALLGARAGDNAQAIELARLLSRGAGGGHVEHKQLRFNRLSALPNLVLGAGFKTLAVNACVGPPWPDIVVATGRRAAPVNLAIKAASGGRTLAVHIGKPRMALDRFDLILTTAQYGLPPAENVVPMVFPFAKTKQVAVEELQGFTQLWAHLPRPWIVGVIGAGKFPVRFGPSELAGFASALNRMAQRCKGSIILMDSPRSPSGAIAAVAARMSGPHWMWTRGQGANPYQAALALGDHLAVTSDSVAMVGEMVRSGKPTHVYRLPVSALVPQWSAQAGVAAVLARRGVLSPPRHVAAFLSGLTDRGWIGDLDAGHPPATPYAATDEHERAVTRIIALWHGHAMD